jgi:hypothetical protein
MTSSFCSPHFRSNRTTNRSGGMLWNVIFYIALTTSDPNPLTFTQFYQKIRRRLFGDLAPMCQSSAPSLKWHVWWVCDNKKDAYRCSKFAD